MPAHLLLQATDPLFRQANYAEAGLWAVIGVFAAAIAFRRSGWARGRCLLLAATMFAFGASDVVEAGTGAWWRPWWLLVWKGTCVLVLLGLFVEHIVLRRQQRRQRVGAPPPPPPATS